jgi:hypothetical protein
MSGVHPASVSVDTWSDSDVHQQCLIQADDLTWQVMARNSQDTPTLPQLGRIAFRSQVGHLTAAASCPARAASSFKHTQQGMMDDLRCS